MRAALPLLLAPLGSLALAACSAPAGTNAVSGQAAGVGFAAPAAVYAVEKDYLGRVSPAPDRTLVVIADAPDLCPLLQTHRGAGRQSEVTSHSLVGLPDGGALPSLFLALDEEHGGAADRRLGLDLFATLDPATPCAPSDAGPPDPVFCRLLTPTSGSARLEHTDDLAGDSASGSFDLSFADGGHLAGHFAAARCDRVFGGSAPSCSSAGPGPDALALLAALALARRRRG